MLVTIGPVTMRVSAEAIPGITQLFAEAVQSMEKTARPRLEPVPSDA